MDTSTPELLKQMKYYGASTLSEPLRRMVLEELKRTAPGPYGIDVDSLHPEIRQLEIKCTYFINDHSMIVTVSGFRHESLARTEEIELGNEAGRSSEFGEAVRELEQGLTNHWKLLDEHAEITGEMILDLITPETLAELSARRIYLVARQHSADIESRVTRISRDSELRLTIGKDYST